MTPESPKREYLIVGAGAIGGTLAFHLARAGHVVRVVDSDVKHVDAIRRHGIILRRDDGSESVAVAAATPDESTITSACRVLLSVKGVGSTERAVDWIAPRLAPEGFVVCAQNGLHVSHVARQLGAHRTVGAFVDFFADVVEPGVILDGGAGALMVGELDGTRSERVDQVVLDLQAWGPACATANIFGYLWSKLGFSAMLAATALADAPMADLIDRHRALMLALAREVFSLSDHFGVVLEPFDSFDPAGLSAAGGEAGIELLVGWLRGQSKDRSGVWRDIAVHGRATEATPRYEDLVCLGQSAGIRLPHLEQLVRMLRQVETGQRPMADENLEELRRSAAALFAR